MFEYKQQEISPPSSSEGQRGADVDVTANGNKDSAPTEGVNDEEGSPPTELKDAERKELFALRQKLSEFECSWRTMWHCVIRPRIYRLSIVPSP